jgi:hypothetical protein
MLGFNFMWALMLKFYGYSLLEILSYEFVFICSLNTNIE